MLFRSSKYKNKWQANICVNYKCYALGYFLSEDRAAKAYDCSALIHFGEFARLNFPSTSLAEIQHGAGLKHFGVKT